MRISLFLLLGVLLAAPAYGQQAELASTTNNSFNSFVAGNSVADDLKALEEKFDSQFKEFEQGFDEAIDGVASDVKKKVNPGTSASTMKVVGRVHVDHWGFPGSDDGIAILEGNPDGPQDQIGFRRVRFGVRGNLPANMEYRIEMEFAGGNDVEFRDVWLGWNDLPFVQKLLVGNQKRPYGWDHLNSSRYNAFLERPFVIESFNQDARRLGIQSHNVSDNQKWNWRYGVFNQRLIQDEGKYVSDHYQLEFAGRIANTFWYDEASGGRGYGHWAISGSFANPDGTAGSANEARFRHRPEARSLNRWLDTGNIVGAEDYQLFGFENIWNFGSLQIGGEYQKIWLNRNGGSDLEFDGGYMFIAYWLTGEHTPWDRKSGTLGRAKPHEEAFRVCDCDDRIRRGLGAWQVALRWSKADFNSDDILGGIGESFTAGLNWHWSSNARVQFNYIHGEIDNNGGVSGDYDIIGTRLMVDF